MNYPVKGDAHPQQKKKKIAPANKWAVHHRMKTIPVGEEEQSDPDNYKWVIVSKF